jgi:hypothetical protein
MQLVERLGYGLDGPEYESKYRQISFLQIVQTGYGIHPASYSMGI